MTEYADPVPVRTWDDDIALLRRALEALRLVDEEGHGYNYDDDPHKCGVCQARALIADLKAAVGDKR